MNIKIYIIAPIELEEYEFFKKFKPKQNINESIMSLIIEYNNKVRKNQNG